MITSVERRRRWSREDKERLVSARLEPAAVISEIARTADIHVSQFFRWRKELCRIDASEALAATTFMPVIVSEVAPAILPDPRQPSGASHPRRKRSNVTSELGRGRPISRRPHARCQFAHDTQDERKDQQRNVRLLR
ncbi:transposase [Rhizobium sp. BT-175]|uniref:transposase n=1 Tax=Rhizobium sp. BT-175 TaxID=2986929 RepID=UPI003555F02A